ncbi:MAG: hypothetical protein IJ003_01375 [Candidatus Gastranaerophilales bacterium]|nr:hypothetical protein [Candidatus Gastranaerophilales bacterium]
MSSSFSIPSGPSVVRTLAKQRARQEYSDAQMAALNNSRAQRAMLHDPMYRNDLNAAYEQECMLDSAQCMNEAELMAISAELNALNYMA